MMIAITSEVAKVTITVGDKCITFEGPKGWVDEQAAKYTGVSGSKQQAQHNSSLLPQAHAAASEKDFVQSKHPRGHSEQIAVLAFHLAENGLPEFTEEDVRRAYIRAGIRPPKVVAQAIRDAKNRYEYVEPGRGRGKYRLTAHGDRTVRFDLPRR